MSTARLNFMPVAAFSILALMQALPAHASGEAELDAGLDAASEYRYAVAIEHFRNAAQQGNSDAQRNLGLMELFGEKLFGVEVHRNRADAIQWLARASNGGCEISTLMIARAGKR